MNYMQSSRHWAGTAVVVAVALTFTMSNARDEPLADLLPEFLNNHNLVKAAKSDIAAAKETALAAKGGWYPALSMTLTGGSEHHNKPTATDNTNMVSREADFVITQRLWEGRRGS